MDVIDMLPEVAVREVVAIRSMAAMQDAAYARRDYATAKDLGNRIAQAMGRFADWEDANPVLTREIIDAHAASGPAGSHAEHRQTGSDAVSIARAKDAYHDASYPKRHCDRCSREYTGPAVYCSLNCALEDA